MHLHKFIFFTDQHQTSASEKGPNSLRRSPSLHPSRQNENVCPPERQRKDPSQETLVAVHVHVLPTRTPSDGAAHFRRPEGGLGREHLHPDPGRRYRFSAARGQSASRLDEEEPELGSCLWTHSPRRVGPHGLVPAVRIRDRSLATKSY